VATLGIAGNIPGTYWTTLDSSVAATFTGDLSVNLSTGWAEDDVLAAYFLAGEVVTINLDADGNSTDFGLALFGPDALDVGTDDALELVHPYFYGGPEAYPLTITSFQVPKSGYYYFNPYTWIDESAANGGSGSYSLSVTVEQPGTWIDITPVPTLAYQSAAITAGRVHSRVDGGITGWAWLMGSDDGVHFEPMDAQQLTDGGDFWFEAPQNSVKMYYVVEYDGNEYYNPSSSHITVNMLAYLTKPAASRYGTRSYRLTGDLGSWHVAGSSAVRIYLWRYVSGHWKAAGYRSAKVAAYAVRSKYSASYKFPYTGKWRMQAYHSDANHATTRSGYTYFTVK